MALLPLPDSVAYIISNVSFTADTPEPEPEPELGLEIRATSIRRCVSLLGPALC